ncbi:reverse transcriptase domain-containing protein [Tanacetum coccineum]
MVARKPTAKEGGQKKTSSNADKPIPVKKPAPAKQTKPGKRSDRFVDEADEEPQPTPKPQIEDDEYNLQRGKGKGIATGEQALEEIGAEVEMSDSEGDIKILNVSEEKGEDVSNTVALEERTVELNEGQAGVTTPKSGSNGTELLDDGFMVVVLDGGEGEGREEKIILTVCFRSAGMRKEKEVILHTWVILLPVSFPIEPERTLNRRLRRQNRRVPYDQRNNPPQNPRIVYPPILNINYFCHFLDILQDYDPMDDEPMWAVNRVVALTPGSAITIPETANEFSIKGNHLTLVKGNQFDGRTKTDPHEHIHEFLRICDMFKYRDTENEAVRLMMFPLSLTGEAITWLDELNEGTIKTWDELRTAFISRFFPPALFDRLLGEIQAFSQHENESLTDAWLCMKEMLRNCHGHNLSKGNIIKILYHGLSEITQEVLNAATNAKYKELQSNAKKTKLDPDEDDIPMSREEEAKFMQTFQTFMDLKTQLVTVAKNHQASIQNLETKFDRLADKKSGRPSGSLPSNTQPNPKGHNSKAYQPPQSRNEHVNAVFTRSADLGASINLMLYSLYAKLSLKTLKPTKMSVRLDDRSFQYPVGIAKNMLVEVGKFTFPADFVIQVKQKQLNLGVGTERMIFNVDSAMKHSYSNDDTCFSIDVIDEILEEDFDALLEEGSKILHSIKGTLLEEEIFVEFDKFMAMIADENSDSESDTEEPPFEKITINTDYKIKTSLEEPPTDLELKPLPDNLEYVFLEEPSFLPVIISSQLSKEKKNKLLSILKKHKEAFA